MAFNKAKALLEAQKHVSEGKISQAIKQYLQIVEKDPTDLILLNTVGDLYIRDKKFSDGMKQFYRLAEAYMKDGFIVKAIAMYRKIAKLEPNAVEPMLKLADLYVTQGLNREAREQYTAALELLQKKKETQKALDVVRKMAQLDPGNPQGKLQVAEFAEKAGDKKEAARAYLEAATIADRMEDSEVAEKALAKVSALEPESPAIPLLRARQARRKKDYAEAERILKATPQLAEEPAAQRLLFDCYIALNRPAEAEKLLLQVYHANPADVSPISNYVGQCLAKRDPDAAFKTVQAVAENLIEQKKTEILMEMLRKIWSQAPEHIDAMELIYSLAERTADEVTIPDVLEALGHVYVKTGQLEKAESTYQRLVGREPQNADYKDLLKQVLQKQGKEYVPADAQQLSDANAALEAPAAEASAESPEEAKAVQEAIDNSELFVRYNLTEKAVTELEKALEIYPKQVRIHKTLFEICRKNLPLRSQQAAETLARIYAEQGDEGVAHYYREAAKRPAGEMASMAPPPQAREAVSRPPSPSAPPHPPETASAPPAAAAKEFDLSQEFSFSEPQEKATAAPVEIPLDLAATPAQEEGERGEAAPPVQTEPAAESAAEAPAFSYEESEEEIKFYLSEGLTKEAEKAVAALEEAYPGNPEVARLRNLLEAPAAEEKQAEGAVAEPSIAGPEQHEWEPPGSFAHPQAAPAPAAETESPSAGSDLLGGLAEGLAEGLDNVGAAAATEASKGKKEGMQAAGAGGSADLSGLLDELGEPGQPEAAGDDPETHYNLGVAFREMGLLDEAIGEFQKVAKVTGKGGFPPNFLQACTLLAACFSEKGMPAIAAKWYLRALETPGLDEEAALSLQYDLGSAYEQAGDTKSALEKFTEVYSQNIDYRDVAEKIRLLQLKAS